MRYERPAWVTLAITSAIALAISLMLALSRPVEMRVDGQRLLSDVAPVTAGVSDTVFIPLRPLGEALGAETKYDEKSGVIDVVRGQEHLHLKVGSRDATLNGARMTLHQPPFRVRGRAMVSLKAVARAFNLRVSYDPRTARIDVNTPGVIEAGAQPDTEQQTTQ